jgi:glutaredoxin
MVKQFLTLKGKEFKVVNLDDNPEKRQELFELTGALTVPITQVDDNNFIIGWNRQKLAEIV